MTEVQANVTYPHISCFTNGLQSNEIMENDIEIDGPNFSERSLSEHDDFGRQLEMDGLPEKEKGKKKAAISTMDARPTGPTCVATTTTGHSFSKNSMSPVYHTSDTSRHGFNFATAALDSIPIQPVSSVGSTGVVCQPSDAQYMECDGFQPVNTGLYGDNVSQQIPSLRNGPKAEVDPTFFGGVRPHSSGEYNHVAMEEDPTRGNDFGQVSGKFMDPSLARSRNEQGIKAVSSASVKPKPVTHRMTKAAFMSHDYDMSHKRRGKAVIVNNVVFKDHEDHQARAGSFNDVQKMREIFERLNLEPVRRSGSDGQLVYTDLTVGQIRDLLRDASDPALNDYTDYDCFIFMVMSYGMDGAVLCAGDLKDEFIEIKEIVENFKPDSCPTLLMKPKIFLLQLDPAFSIEIADAAQERDPLLLKPNVQKVPKEADLLVQCCYVSGFYGWLDNNERGLSWYVRALTQGLQKFVIEPLLRGQKSLEFLSVLSRVNYLFIRIMSQEGLTPDRQIGGPQVMTTFTKRMIFQVKDSENF